MKNLLFAIFSILLLASCSKQNWSVSTSSCSVIDKNKGTIHIKGQELQQIIEKYTKKGMPGIAFAISDEQGYWAGGSGFAQLENLTPMLPCHLQYSQSVAKTYMAVTILKLYDQGKINLDEKITVYLPRNISGLIDQADKITVRMLLNHTAGIPEYNANPAYVSYLLQHPLHQFTSMDYLGYVKGKPLKFEPGTKMSYSNTNYLLLALIGDQITGNHAKYMQDEIFKPLNLSNTFYREHTNYLDNPYLVNSYWDRYSNGIIENCSKMQQANVSTLIGDDGIIASPTDYVVFLQSLFEGKILKEATLDQMLTFFKNDPSKDYGYGLGIGTNQYKQQLYYRHSGGGIGAGCQLLFFPEQKAYFFIAINLGTIIDSPIFKNFPEMEAEIYDVLIK